TCHRLPGTIPGTKVPTAAIRSNPCGCVRRGGGQGMPSRYRKKPLAQCEHGTRIYAPTEGETRFRVVTTDPATSERLFVKLATEEAARSKARELEQFIAQSAPVRGRRDEGP